ncbi:MAG: glycosyltransferase family 4 protein [Acidobacteria bacterium]|nr:glycosyltransferase family 4 protein [Acidobacteriota bacterium]
MGSATWTPAPPGDAALRVAILTRAVYPLHGYGGLERHVHDLVRQLTLRGVAVTLITRPASPSAPGDDRGALAGCSLVSVPYRTFPFAGRRGTTVLDRSTAYPWFGYRAGRVAARLAAGHHIDVVHGLGASALGYALARTRHPDRTVPFVFNPQGLEEFGGTGHAYGGSRLKQWAYIPLQAAVRACARAADRVIATDRSIEPTVRAHLRVPPERIRLVPNAVDLEECDRLAGPDDGRRVRAALGLCEDDTVFVSVGRLEENKGFHVLARALAGIARLPWRWVLIGGGPHAPALERLIASLGIGARVTFAGRVDTRVLHAWYEAATVFVHPTLYEGSSLVTLEAMAHRRAVVATRAGGLPDKVEPGVTGWLVEPGDFQALSAAIGDAIEDRTRLGRMGLAGRILVERQFSWPVVTGRLLDVYRELAGGAGSFPLRPPPDLPYEGVP